MGDVPLGQFIEWQKKGGEKRRPGFITMPQFHNGSEREVFVDDGCGRKSRMGATKHGNNVCNVL